MRQDDVSIGMCFQQTSGQAFIWRIERFFKAIDGRRYAVLRRTDSPSDQKTLAIMGLLDRALFKRLMSAEPALAEGA